ncbi:MAG: hypothetical protein E6Q97_36235 [Desulfurellales bacterium]|nr:MAG: hypothetical protein E6Q97_36235 [Desulfurellales bacterium]
MLEVAILLLAVSIFLVWAQIKVDATESWRTARKVNKANFNQLLELVEKFRSGIDRDLARVNGLYMRVHIESKIAEKFAERANSVAGATAIGLGMVQKALAQPRILTSETLKKQAMAEHELKKLFGEDPFDWNLEEPELDEEEKDVLQKARQHYTRFGMNGKGEGNE